MIDKILSSLITNGKYTPHSTMEMATKVEAEEVDTVEEAVVVAVVVDKGVVEGITLQTSIKAILSLLII